MEKRELKSVLFITQVTISSVDQKGIYIDLFRYFRDKGHFVFILSPLERKHGKKSYVIEGDGYKIIRFKIPNINKAGKVEKALSMFLYDFRAKTALKNFLKIDSLDLVVYSTPPITVTNTINYLIKTYGTYNYLLLKDIFPQNAVDLGILSDSSFITNYFRNKESILYRLSDKIGCMSQANVDYILKNNDEIKSSKVEICPNSIIIEPLKLGESDKISIRHKYKIPLDATLFLYGGNLGKPQGIEFLISLLKKQVNDTKVFFLIIGSGTEYNKLSNYLLLVKPKNVLLLSQLPKEDYDKIVSVADVGLILLDYRFTIPNYPSRLLGYLNQKKPVLVMSDVNSDIGINAYSRGYGYWCHSDDLEKASDLVKDYCNLTMSQLRIMGEKGHTYLKKNYSIEVSYNVILNSFLSS